MVNNTNVKLIYKLNDDFDQKTAANLTGEKTVMRQSTRQETNMGVGEVTDTDERQLMSVQEPLYSHNYFAQFKPRVGVIVGLGLAKLCFTSPVKVEKRPLPFQSFPLEPTYSVPSVEDVSQMEAPVPATKSKKSGGNVQAQSKIRTVDPFDTLHNLMPIDVHHSSFNDSLDEVK